MGKLRKSVVSRLGGSTVSKLNRSVGRRLGSIPTYETEIDVKRILHSYAQNTRLHLINQDQAFMFISPDIINLCLSSEVILHRTMQDLQADSIRNLPSEEDPAEE